MDFALKINDLMYKNTEQLPVVGRKLLQIRRFR